MQPILKINLSTEETREIEIPKDWQNEYLGGASLGARLLYKHLVPELDPLSPEAPLLFMCGPLTGTSGPAVGRFVICGRSPATGLWAESNCGGFWGPELRKTGYDGLWIEGKAEKPIYLWINNGQVEIRAASHLWGRDTYQTQTAIQQELNAGKVRVANIGQAGEALIPYALVLCDHGRVAGRTGMGAVMGSKNLKAIAVKGNQKIPINNPSDYKSLRSSANRNLRTDAMTQVLNELGTSGAAEYFDYLQEMPKKYFQNGKLGQELHNSGAYVKENLLTGVQGCHACVIACGRVVKLSDGEKRKGPEYETLMGFGPNLLLNDPSLATRLGELCDRYGMDTISISNTIGLAFRLYELGIINLQDTGGLELDWGKAEVVEPLIHQTVQRTGFGELLAGGAYNLANYFNASEEAVQVNGLEVAYHDPRGASGMALVYATSPRGACHNQSDYFFVDVGQVEPTLGMDFFSPRDGAEKARNVTKHQDWRTVFNSLVMCIFANLDPETVLDLINASTGLDWSVSDMLQSGERAWNLKRGINNRLGLVRVNDCLPNAFLQPYSDSGEEDAFYPDFEAMLAAYYRERCWDSKNGYPTRKKLLELNLDFVVEDLYS
jgi:aldehyde:ferredoxin oxidoreductase